MQLHFEAGDAVGLFLEGHEGESFAPLGLVAGGEGCGGQLLFLEALVKAARLVERHGIAPGLLAGAVHHHESLAQDAAQQGELPLRAAAHPALDMDLFVGAVNGPFGEDVGHLGGRLRPAGKTLKGPLQPVVPAGKPLVVGVKVGTILKGCIVTLLPGDPGACQTTVPSPAVAISASVSQTALLPRRLTPSMRMRAAATGCPLESEVTAKRAARGPSATLSDRSVTWTRIQRRTASPSSRRTPTK